MKFCYIDESGTGSEPYAVMVGIIVDAQRMRPTKKVWENLLVQLSGMIGRQVTEIHTSNFYSGNGIWRGLDGQRRSDIVSAIFNWLVERKHDIVYTAVDKAKYFRDFRSEPLAIGIPSLWSFMALHLTLSIQKNFQNERNNKGNTVLIFDHEEQCAKEFARLIYKPPEWTDEYYNRERKQEQLDQIIDTPFFGDSNHVAMIQVADFLSYFLRRYIEFSEGVITPDYEGEQQKIQGWMRAVFARSVRKSVMYPVHSRCDCSDLYYRYAPPCILQRGAVV